MASLSDKHRIPYDSLMPYGKKHKNQHMSEIPDDYYVWLWSNNRCSAFVMAWIMVWRPYIPKRYFKFTPTPYTDMNGKVTRELTEQEIQAIGGSGDMDRAEFAKFTSGATAYAKSNNISVKDAFTVLQFLNDKRIK